MALLDVVQVEVGAEEELEEADVEEVAVDGIVAGDGVAEADAVVVRGAVDADVIEQVRQVRPQELHQPLRLGRRHPAVLPLLRLLRRGHRAAARRSLCFEAQPPPPGG